MIGRERNYCLIALVALLVVGAAPAAAFRHDWAATDPRVVRPSPLADANRDRVSDFLEARFADGTFTTVGPRERGVADLIVALDHPPHPTDFVAVAMAGGEVIEHWSRLVYAMRVALPAGRPWGPNLRPLLRVPGVVLIGENARCEGTLYLSTRQTRARQVWSPPHGLQGDGSHNIAILDSGIDDSHPDLAKVIGWQDFVTGYPTPTDPADHGSHIAGIAAGLGTAAGISSGVGLLPVSEALHFPTTDGWAYSSYFPIDTTCAGGPVTVTSYLKWGPPFSPDRTMCIKVRDDAWNSLADGCASADSVQPLAVSWSADPGRQAYTYVSRPYQSAGGVLPYWVQARTAMCAAGDGFNLMRGMAPGASLVGVKVLDDYASGLLSNAVDGLEWTVANKDSYQIVAANLSLGSNLIDPAIDTVVNNAVAEGVVVCCAAGNTRGGSYPYIYSPASASAAITVAATNEHDAIASYSSYGGLTSFKPDVAAPGGSLMTARELTSVDSNDGDLTLDLTAHTYTLYPDAYPDDYKNKSGTSMACPHVAGAAALVAQAMGAWSWTREQALRVKMFLEMTATETNQDAEYPIFSPRDPPLDRGGKDTSEGFGRINTDAAVEAVTMSHAVGATSAAALGSGAADRKCWARRVALAGGASYRFTLVNPAAADYDLYLYRDSYTDDGSTSMGSVGDPMVAAQSTTAGPGGSEEIAFAPAASADYYLVVKWVAGDGSFSLSSCGPPSVQCPADVTAPSPDCAPIAVEIGTAAASGGCGAVTITNDAPAFFPPGTTAVTWTACDEAGNCDSCAQTVAVSCRFCFDVVGNCRSMVALPGRPVDPDPWEVFDELRPPNKELDLLSGNLVRYDPEAEGYAVYYEFAPSEFGPVTPGEGYWLWAFYDDTICYDAVPLSGAQARHLPVRSWYLVGSPHPADIHLDDTLWYHGAEGPYPFSAIMNVWVQDPLIPWWCWLGGYGRCGLLPIDDDHYLRAFQGYWLYAFVDDVTMGIPAP